MHKNGGNMGYYVNKSHLGGIYFTTQETEHKFCKICGDCDETLGNISTVKQLRTILNKYGFENYYREKAIKEFEQLIEGLENDR